MRTNIKQTKFFPLPVVVIGTYDKSGHADAMTAAWATMYDFDQILVVIDKSHKTAKNLMVSKAVSIAFATKDTLKIADYVGCVSANNNKNKVAKLDYVKAKTVNAPIFRAFPVALECKVLSYKDEILIAQVLSMNVDKKYLKNNKLDYDKINPISYDMVSSCYRSLGKKISKAFITRKI